MIQGFYITTEDCIGEAVAPDSWEGPIKKGTPIAMIYFDERGMEFIDGSECIDDAHNCVQKTFRLVKPCPVVAACSCPYCSKIVPTSEIQKHVDTDSNCMRVRGIKNW